jgi:plasmid maintenance system killer protein
MKQISFAKFLACVLMVFACVFFAGCSKDEDKGPDYSSLPIVGTWELIFDYEDGSTYHIITTFKSDGTGIEDQYEVLPDGSKLIVNKDYPMSFEWSGNKNTFTITSKNAAVFFNESYFWEVSDIPYSVEEETQLKILEFTFTKK